MAASPSPFFTGRGSRRSRAPARVRGSDKRRSALAPHPTLSPRRVGRGDTRGALGRVHATLGSGRHPGRVSAPARPACARAVSRHAQNRREACADQGDRRPARGRGRRHQDLPELRPPPSSRSGLAAHVRRGGGGPLHARLFPSPAHRRATRSQAAWKPGSAPSPRASPARARSANFRPSTVRSSRGAAATAGAARARRGASTIDCRPWRARPAATQPASMSRSAMR